MTALCLECSSELTPSRAGKPKRYCSPSCRKTFENRARERGQVLYHLFRVYRRQRREAERLKVWTEMCRLELSWNDDDNGRQTWKPAAMALHDIYARDQIPSTNIFLKERAA